MFVCECGCGCERAGGGGGDDGVAGKGIGMRLRFVYADPQRFWRKQGLKLAVIRYVV